jgi:TM2 domain-containing membrane protein YozV
MRGQVLGVDRTSGDGQISGEDGVRYVFRPDDWCDARGPGIGAHVDFTSENGRALRIFRVPEAQTVKSAPPQPTTDRNKIVAALLAFFLGMLGIHRFYLGRTGTGVLMLVLSATVIGLFVTGLWAFVDMIRYLFMSDSEFAQRYARTASTP